MSSEKPTSTNWQRKYASVNPDGTYGPVKKAPDYPDTSIGTYTRKTGKVLFGYNAWRDKQIADYNTAMAEYKNWYESTSQQMSRITDAGLNPNLAYGMASPGQASNQMAGPASGPSPEQVVGVGAQVLGTMFSGIKSLAEAANIVAALPESRMKGRIARLVDVASASGAINAHNSYLSQLDGARVMLGVGTSKAEREQADNVYNSSKSTAEKSLLDYLTSHDEEGNESDFSSSIYLSASKSAELTKIIDYKKISKEWSQLLSKDSYWKGLLEKTVNEGIISRGEAWKVEHILSNPMMDDKAKFLALQKGVPGFIAQVCYEFTSGLMEIGQSVHNFFHPTNKEPVIEPTTPPNYFSNN